MYTLLSMRSACEVLAPEMVVSGQKFRRKHGHAENRTGIPRTRTIYGSNGLERWKFSRLLISPGTGARGCSRSRRTGGPSSEGWTGMAEENKMRREIGNWKERGAERERERMRKKREKSGIQYIFSVNNRGRKKGGRMDPLLLLDFFFNYGYSERKR